jgi:protein kinase A
MIQGLGHGKALDWWCLGIFLYELTVGFTPFYAKNVEEMYYKISEGKLRFPARLSENCKNLIEQVS